MGNSQYSQQVSQTHNKARINLLGLQNQDNEVIMYLIEMNKRNLKNYVYYWISKDVTNKVHNHDRFEPRSHTDLGWLDKVQYVIQSCLVCKAGRLYWPNWITTQPWHPMTSSAVVRVI